MTMITTRQYSIDRLRPYIDWTYFLHAWQMPPKYASAATLHQCRACQEAWVESFGADCRNQAREALNLVLDAFKMLQRYAAEAEVLGRVGLFEANSVEDDIIVVTNDAYNMMLAQTLCDRLAEAAACVLHLETRCEIWGYAPDENLSVNDLLHERYQGIRPAVGYPSLPDQSINFVLNDLIKMEELGITLTENGAMRPHATVTGLMIAYAEASYFAVGQIDETQMKDYARRRGLPEGRIRQFLAANLKTVS